MKKLGTIDLEILHLELFDYIDGENNLENSELKRHGVGTNISNRSFKR